MPLVFLIQGEASQESIHLTRNKVKGLAAFYVIICYFREQNQFPTQHLFLTGIYIFFEVQCFTMSEKAMAPHSSTLAWKISWTEEPGGLQPMGSL